MIMTLDNQQFSQVEKDVDRSDYFQEASRQLQDKNVYEDVRFNENILKDLVERSNKTFKRLCSHKLIPEKELKYFTYNFNPYAAKYVYLRFSSIVRFLQFLSHFLRVLEAGGILNPFYTKS